MRQGILLPAGRQDTAHLGHMGQHRTVSVLGSPCLDCSKDFALAVVHKNRLDLRSKDCHNRGCRNDWACQVGARTGAGPAVVPGGHPLMPAEWLGLLTLQLDSNQSLQQAWQVQAGKVVDIVVEIQIQGRNRREWKMPQEHSL